MLCRGKQVFLFFIRKQHQSRNGYFGDTQTLSCTMVKNVFLQLCVWGLEGFINDSLLFIKNFAPAKKLETTLSSLSKQNDQYVEFFQNVLKHIYYYHVILKCLGKVNHKIFGLVKMQIMKYCLKFWLPNERNIVITFLLYN